MKLSRSRPEQKGELPLIPLKNLVVFPGSVASFFLDQQDAINSLSTAAALDKRILVVFQKSKTLSIDSVSSVATVCRIIQALKLPEGRLRVLAEGLTRVHIKRIRTADGCVRGSWKKMTDSESSVSPNLIKNVKESFQSYAAKNRKKFPRETVAGVVKTDSPEKLVGLVCYVLDIVPERKLPFLEETDDNKRLEELLILLHMENESISLRQNISSKARQRMERTQKEYFLNEQLREIHKELGNAESDPTGAKELQIKLSEMDLTPEVREKALTEAKRLARLQPMSPDAGILRTYLEWITDLPWGVRTSDRSEIAEAERILDSDHFGLEDPKERILDFLAVRQISSQGRSPVLCFVGPPGTGKTSLGRSVARALGRKFVRISLGGVRDEAEIRGHRKTYVGALPGKIIQACKRAGSVNPVFLLDEIDKIANDYRGDPSSALLEVLDPEQNNTFTDHYLELPFDLSQVMFITTANSLEDIPHPLRDRMEVIRIPGYTMLEKKNIARQFLIPKQMRESGLDGAAVSFSEESLDLLIRGYTLEAGVRNMERAVGRIIRKITRNFLQTEQTRPGRWIVNSSALHKNQQYSAISDRSSRYTAGIKAIQFEVTPELVRKYLGNERPEDDPGTQGRPGLAPGLYYDGGGGGVLPIEARIFEGNGKLLLTGQLGDVMKESAQIALSFIRANKHLFGLDSELDQQKDIHVHVPQGAIPVDGPSAGIALSAALLSAAKDVPLKTGIVMTGEVTLTGRVLPVGGIKEKSLAARRRGFGAIIMPEGNRRDAGDLPPEVKDSVTFIFQDNLTDALLELFPDGCFSA